VKDWETQKYLPFLNAILSYNKKVDIQKGEANHMNNEKEALNQEQANCGCSNNCHEGCDCGHEHSHEHEHDEHDVVTLILDDNSELKCPVIDIFDIEEQSYIALLHPVEETVLLYRFTDYEDGTIEIDTIEDDAEFERVSSTFNALNEAE
jgi:uncharacterized protein YrzB (UPF0473 family)